MTIGFIDLGGERLEYLQLAPERSGTPLVFLHEGLGSVAAWRGFPRALCDRLQAPGLLYSRRGYGQSAPLAAPRGTDYLHHEAWQVLPALLQALGIEAPLLVGHSDGGSIALLYAARHAPAAIAVMAPHVFVEEITLAGVRAARAAWDSSEQPGIANTMRTSLARLHADAAGAFFGWHDAWLAPAFADWNIERELAAIRCPVLAIQGHDDQYGTMAQLDRIERALPAGARCTLLKLDACGHSPHRDQPQRVMDAIATLHASLATDARAPR